MENKKTTELLDLLGEKNKDGDDVLSPDEQEEILVNLRSRTPFFDILESDWDESLPAAIQRIRDLEDEVVRLKRHRHDPKTDDVVIRI